MMCFHLLRMIQLQFLCLNNEKFELLILREVCHSLAKFGSELVGFSLKKKIYSALFQKDLEMEQQVNKLLWDIDKKIPQKENPKFKLNIRNVDELLEM